MGIWNKHLVSQIVSKPGTYSIAISKDCVTCSRGPDARGVFGSPVILSQLIQAECS
jgi:hypothetical protein